MTEIPPTDLSSFSQKELEAELKKRREDKLKLMREQRALRADFLLNRVDALLQLVEHSRTTCSDEKPINTYRCSRCFILHAKEDNFWDEEYDMTTRLEQLRPVEISYNG